MHFPTLKCLAVSSGPTHGMPTAICKVMAGVLAWLVAFFRFFQSTATFARQDACFFHP